MWKLFDGKRFSQKPGLYNILSSVYLYNLTMCILKWLVRSITISVKTINQKQVVINEYWIYAYFWILDVEVNLRL